MKPNTPHAVIAAWSSLVCGYHYWSTHMLASTLTSEITCLLGDATITNTSHSSMRVTIHRLLAFQYEAMICGKKLLIVFEEVFNQEIYAVARSKTMRNPIKAIYTSYIKGMAWDLVNSLDARCKCEVNGETHSFANAFRLHRQTERVHSVRLCIYRRKSRRLLTHL
jgi:hypothetical protein